MLDPIGSEAGSVNHRGAFVALGNTHPTGWKQVCGLLERGVPSDGTFNSHTGAGYVKAEPGDYAFAKSRNVEAVLLLCETFGGLGPELVEHLRRAAEYRDNKLTASEYDETTWSARSWLSFAKQRISIALHRAVATEIGQALGLAVGTDPRA